MSKNVVIIPGDGIGPEIMDSVIQVLDKLGCGLTYKFCNAGLASLEKDDELLPKKTLDLIRDNKVVLKGPITTPIGEGFKSINVTLRQMFDLYANVRPAISYEGVPSVYQNVNLTVIRENTEGIYSGKGQIVSEDKERAQAISVITRQGSEKILRFAFELAVKKNLKRVAVIHKANILKTTSGLFLKVARDISNEYPQIDTKEYIVDNACMQLVLNPYQFEMIVTTNLFGDIISDLCAGLVGGLGLAPGANIGQDIAMFEAVHGSAPDIAGKNLANPTALLLAAGLMLEHIGMEDKSEVLKHTIREVLKNEKYRTKDLKGHSSTTDFTQAILKNL